MPKGIRKDYKEEYQNVCKKGILKTRICDGMVVDTKECHVEQGKDTGASIFSVDEQAVAVDSSCS